MHTTITIIVNAVLMAGILAAVAWTLRLPFRIEREERRLEHAVYLPSRERGQLDRAA